MANETLCSSCGFPVDSREHLEGRYHDGNSPRLQPPAAAVEAPIPHEVHDEARFAELEGRIYELELFMADVKALMAAEEELDVEDEEEEDEPEGDKSEPDPAPAPPKKALSGMNKAELLATAQAEGVTANESMNNDSIAAAIKAAREAT